MAAIAWALALREAPEPRAQSLHVHANILHHASELD
jgi:hypothetical protein